MLIALGVNDALLRYMTWKALFDDTWFAPYISTWGAFPVDPDGADPGGYRNSLRLLRQGERVVVFPEGERTRTGELLPFREGATRLAIAAGVPIYPIRIEGAHKAWPRGEFAPRPLFRIRVHFYPPIYPRAVKAGPERRAESARITALLREKLQAPLDL